MKDVFSVVVRPLLTEKTTDVGGQAHRYCFEVKSAANKIEIRQAVEQLFGVKVASVRTLVQRGKEKRFGKFHGRRSNWKKAYVTLQEGHEIDLLANS
jgi:large subunit ribosomal protein L23